MSDSFGPTTGVGGDVDRAVSIYASSAGVLLTLSVLSAVPAFVLQLAVGDWSLLTTPITSIYSAVIFAAMVFVCYAVIEGRTTSLGEAWSAAFDRLGAIVEYTLRLGGTAILLLITVIGIPFAIRVLVRWFFGTEAIILRDKGGKEAISYSCQIVEGRWWYVFGLLLLLGLVITPGIIIAIAIGGTAGYVAQTVVSVLLAPLGAAFWTSVFLRLERQSSLPEDDVPSANLEA